MTVLSFPGSVPAGSRPPIAVPKVVDQPLDDARSVLEGLGLRVRVVQVVGVGQKDTVFSQRPPEGSTLPSGGQVTLQVFIEPPGSQVPRQIAEALKDLKDDVAAVQADTTQLGTDLGTVQDDVNQLGTNLGTVQDDVTAIGTSLADVKTDTAAIRDAVVKKGGAAKAGQGS